MTKTPASPKIPLAIMEKPKVVILGPYLFGSGGMTASITAHMCEDELTALYIEQTGIGNIPFEYEMDLTAMDKNLDYFNGILYALHSQGQEATHKLHDRLCQIIWDYYAGKANWPVGKEYTICCLLKAVGGHLGQE